MVTGMIQSKNCQLPAIAGQTPDPIKRESQVKKYTRWLRNDKVNANIFFLPFIEKVIKVLATDQIFLIFDGSTVARDSACLMASIIYQKRAIPIAWIPVEGRKGHFTEAVHIELLHQVKSMLPQDAKVIVLGDGEFDGINFLQSILDAGWDFAVRTSKNTNLYRDKTKLTLPVTLPNNQIKSYAKVLFTGKKFGPVTAVTCRIKNGGSLQHLISSSTSANEIVRWYKKRCIIETLFSDKKSRGFKLDKSLISDISRIGRLIIVTSLAYIWLVLLGDYAKASGLVKAFHRTERCDLSLLQLGFRLLEYLIHQQARIPEIRLLQGDLQCVR